MPSHVAELKELLSRCPLSDEEQHVAVRVCVCAYLCACVHVFVMCTCDTGTYSMCMYAHLICTS